MFKDNQKKYDLFRKEFNFFVYERYHIEQNTDELLVSFTFRLDNKYTFQPRLRIAKKNLLKSTIHADQLNNFIFNIGMIELISYWKAACPPTIIVKSFSLNSEQINFWKKIYFLGLGEFFYTNGISAKLNDFVEIISESDKKAIIDICEPETKKVIVPIGGGKDSIVTMELLKDKFDVVPFILNPRQASLETCFTAGFERTNIFEVQRSLDPQILQLNNKGFLNGHTPFSSLLGFVSLVVARLAGAKYIALSNESSANEPTVAGGANHQYSKSLEFETDFRNYVRNYVSRNIDYFSFLRPLSEYQIASVFTKYTKYFPVFKSCNAGSKTDTWCGTCPKCLFTYIILSPFLSEEDIIKIFGRNLFQDNQMTGYLNELTGQSPVKPFECVGTTKEVNFALSDIITQSTGELPHLLAYYKSLPLFVKNNENEKGKMLTHIEKNHHLPANFFDILTSTIHG